MNNMGLFKKVGPKVVEDNVKIDVPAKKMG